jgi:phage tail-like protein
MIEDDRRSTYLDLLPAIYSHDPFLGRFLLAFEQVFSGLPGNEDEPRKGIEETIDGLATLFTSATPTEFLPWLSSWVALTLRADLDEGQQRAFLANIVGLYKRRGTKGNLAQLLKIYTTFEPVITEFDAMPPEAKGLAHHFHVKIRIPSKHDLIDKWEPVARALIELQKPAHTTYSLSFEMVTMQIGVTSHVGVDTVIGTLSDPK